MFFFFKHLQVNVNIFAQVCKDKVYSGNWPLWILTTYTHAYIHAFVVDWARMFCQLLQVEKPIKTINKRHVNQQPASQSCENPFHIFHFITSILKTNRKQKKKEPFLLQEVWLLQIPYTVILTIARTYTALYEGIFLCLCISARIYLRTHMLVKVSSLCQLPSEFVFLFFFFFLEMFAALYRFLSGEVREVNFLYSSSIWPVLFLLFFFFSFWAYACHVKLCVNFCV